MDICKDECFPNEHIKAEPVDETETMLSTVKQEDCSNNSSSEMEYNSSWAQSFQQKSSEIHFQEVTVKDEFEITVKEEFPDETETMLSTAEQEACSNNPSSEMEHNSSWTQSIEQKSSEMHCEEITVKDEFEKTIQEEFHEPLQYVVPAVDVQKKEQNRKIDNSKKTGSERGKGLKLTDVDNAGVNIIGRDSPGVRGLNCSETRKPKASCYKGTGSMCSSPQTLAPVSYSVKKKKKSKKRDVEVDFGEEDIQFKDKKLKLQVELLKQECYLKSLEILKLERELKVPGNKLHFPAL